MVAEPSRRRGGRRIVLILLLNLFIVCVLLFIVELYFRSRQSYIVRPGTGRALQSGLVESNPAYLVKYTPQGRRLIPGARVIIRNHWLSGRDIEMNINSLGFRDDELAEPKAADEVRVLVLGDSITWGDYLQAAEVYVERAESYLADELPGVKVEVINGGVGDIGIKEAVDILAESAPAVEPDVVVLAFYLNDSRPPWGFPGELGSYGVIRRHSVLAQVVYRELKLRKWMRQKGNDRFEWAKHDYRLDWPGNRQAFLALTEKAKFDWGAAWEEDSWKVVDHHLARLKALSEERGFEVVVMAFPVVFQVEALFVEDSPQRLLARRTDELGFYFLDLLPLLRKQKNKADLFYDNCHPKVHTNDLIGRELATFLEVRILPKINDTSVKR